MALRFEPYVDGEVALANVIWRLTKSKPGRDKDLDEKVTMPDSADVLIEGTFATGPTQIITVPAEHATGSLSFYVGVRVSSNASRQR